MRNIFDQYQGPENRLSHALAVCLDEDRKLLAEFLVMIQVEPPVTASKLMLVEQSLPGDASETDEEEADRRGLPDIIIHDGEAWCVLIESKVTAPLKYEQIERHERTLRRRGFNCIHCLALVKREVHLPKRAIRRTWSDLYEWLGIARGGREWPGRLRSYLRAAEARLALTEGTLTMFDGFPFSPNQSPPHRERRRLLRMAMGELRKARSLRALGVDLEAGGRTAIKGLWDFLPLRDAPKGGAFTRYPHLALSMSDDYLKVAITIPNGVKGDVRRRLDTLGPRRLAALNARILRQTKRSGVHGASVWAYANQRHFLHRSNEETDGKLEFKLQTVLRRGTKGVKYQPEWMSFLSDLLRRKRSNIQCGYEVRIPWDTKGLDSQESIKLIVDSWLALKPLLDVVRGSR